MQLNVTTERGVLWLTAAIAASAAAVAIALAHVTIDIVMPPELAQARELLLQTAYLVTFLTCMMVAVPFGFAVSKSLLKAHLLQRDIIAMAQTDHLTGLPNRAAVLGSIERAVAAGVVTGRKGTVLFVDLDHFKKINDTFGHAGGDLALRHAAEIMRATLGPDAILGRFGGEEFVCFIENADNAPAIAARIITSLRRSSAAFGDKTIPVKASIGLADTDGSDDTQHLLSRADEALYIAKSSGRDCIVSYDEVALLRLVADSINKPLRRRATDHAEPLAEKAA